MSTARHFEPISVQQYLSIDSLAAYVLVEQDSPAVLVFRRGESGFSRETYVGLDSMIPLPEIDCQLSLFDLYEDVEFTRPRSEDPRPKP